MGGSWLVRQKAKGRESKHAAVSIESNVIAAFHCHSRSKYLIKVMAVGFGVNHLESVCSNYRRIFFCFESRRRSKLRADVQADRRTQNADEPQLPGSFVFAQAGQTPTLRGYVANQASLGWWGGRCGIAGCGRNIDCWRCRAGGSSRGFREGARLALPLVRSRRCQVLTTVPEEYLTPRLRMLVGSPTVERHEVLL